jgi:type VI secretion system protein VasG
VRAEPRSLVRNLTATATQYLESAVARAVSSSHREIGVEHLLAKMLESEDGDCARMIRHMQRDRVRLGDRLEKILGSFKSDNQGKPVFSQSLFQWLEDTWVLTSLEHGASRIRSGALFLQFLREPSRYSAEELPELEDMPSEALCKEFEDLIASSPEASESLPAKGDDKAVAARRPAEGGALSRFTMSFTDRAAAGEIDPIFGRHREIRQLADILTRRRKNNPIIVGEPGVGKTALVEGLALAIVRGDVPTPLRDVDLRNLDLGLLQAGAGVRGEFENRLKAVISEVKGSLKPVVLFIDEAHAIIGAGGAAGSTDAANLLKPELARGDLRTIAATTWSEYKKYIEKDAALERRFQPVKVDEPSVEQAIGMLRGLCPTFAAAHGITIRDEAVVAAVQLAERYISGRQLPDKAVDVLDTAGARVRIELDTKPEALVELEADRARLERERDARKADLALGGPDRVDTELKEAVANVEAELASVQDALDTLIPRWHREVEAVIELRQARLALQPKLSDADATADAGGDAAPAAGKGPEDLEARQRRVGEAAEALATLQGEDPLIHPDVDADVVARVVSGWTGIPLGKMRSEAIGTVLDLEDRLRLRVRGQDDAICVIGETIRMAHAALRNPSTPIGALLFVGPSGVGKTEAALALADTLYGGERFMTTINMSEFQEKHTVSRLIGSPPGYVGFGEGGVLTEAVRQRPYSVVLLDEVEKADPEVMNLFYQVFDKGVLNDGEGRSIDFRNTIVVMTSNLGTDAIMDLYAADEPPEPKAAVDAVRPLLNKQFKPALVARMTVVPFAPISPPILRQIATMKLDVIMERLVATHGITAEVDPGVAEIVARRCTDPQTGARNIEHVMRSSLLPLISRELLKRFAHGEQPKKLNVGVSPSEEWRVELFD